MKLAERNASEIATARAAQGMTIAQVAKRANVAPSTVDRILKGEAGVHVDTLCAVAAAVGLDVTIKLYPIRAPSLRDSGQLRIAELLRGETHPGWRAALELTLTDGRAADVVFFGADEIIDTEIERNLVDFQAQYRAAVLKRDALQARYDRPVRLVLCIEDTRRNREVLAPHTSLIRSALPATATEVWRALRTGRPLGQDGLLWIRPWRGASRTPMNRRSDA